MTPLALEMLIWFHTRPREAGPFPHIDYPPQTEIVTRFCQNDLVKPYDIERDGTYRTTERGAAWLELILQTPYPKQLWVDPREFPTA